MRPPLDLDGPAPVWPRPVDAALEWWAALPARGRVLLRMALAATLALAATGGLVDGRWGPPRDVLVVTRDVRAGTTVTVADVAVRRWPRDLVPAAALTAAADLPAAAVADGSLAAGTVLTPGNVRGGGLGATAPAGTAVVPVPGGLLPPLPVGTTIDLAVGGFDGTARVVARAAVVVADDGAWQWLRIDRTDVGAVAGGVGDGTLVAAVVGAGP